MRQILETFDFCQVTDVYLFQIEIDHLEDLLKEKFANDFKSLNDHCISHLTNFFSIIKYLHPVSFIFIVKYKSRHLQP